MGPLLVQMAKGKCVEKKAKLKMEANVRKKPPKQNQ